MLKTFKRIVRRIGNRLGVLPQPGSAGGEMPDSYFDAAFHDDHKFHLPFYESPYYPTWLVVVDRLRRYGSKSILDVGCGPGQFAALIEDSGFSAYTGIDFSTVAIQTAQSRTPRFQFRTGDVRHRATYEGIEFDAIICMEVLEHIEYDFAVLACFPPKKRCLMTVPNFPFRSHVRHFEDDESVHSRYGKFFDELSVTRLKGIRSDKDQFYLMDGIRSTFVRSTSE